MTVTATTTALATATKVKGIWVTWRLLAAAGEDNWWQRISSPLSADFEQIFVGLFFEFPPNCTNDEDGHRSPHTQQQ
jgi:hypothetical protein